MRYALLAIIFALAPVLLTSCDTGVSAEVNIQGEYSGSFVMHGVDNPVTMDLDERWGNVLRGEATFVVQGDTIAYSVNGIHKHPNFSIALTSQAGIEYTVYYVGTVDSTGSRLTGSLEGSVYQNASLVLER